MPKQYAYPVWRTQLGGLVRRIKGKYIFIEKSNHPDFNIGDEMPIYWSLIPENILAEKALNRKAQCLIGIPILAPHYSNN